MAESQSSPPKLGSCPICRRPSDVTYRPFCSRRCADVDLSRWLTGAYAIGGTDDGEHGGGAAPAESDGQDQQ